MDLSKIIDGELTLKDGIWFSSTNGYWSLINQDKMQIMLTDLPIYGCRGMVQRNFPQWEDLIFSMKRAAGIGMMDFQKDEIIVDIGCMWGALTVPLAKTNCKVIGIDQTKESLLFLRKRLTEENLSNVDLICADLNEISFQELSVDKFIVNGVLEWIPEKENVAFGRKKIKKNKYKSIIKYYKNNITVPKEKQLCFLKKINKALKNGGILYLAIENRYDVSFFFGSRDPHTGLKFVNILPRFLQTLYSFLMSGRPFLAWIYSERELKDLLYSSGFTKVEIMYAFPDYHFPQLILSNENLKGFYPIKFIRSRRMLGKLLWWLVEMLFYKILKLKGLSPSFIVFAKK